MESLLFLAHRLPYPPNKGDKIRSYHMLRYLAQRYRVYLGTFIDDPDDWRYVESLQDLCAEVYVRPLHPLRAKLRSLRGLVTGQALTLPYYRDESMARWAHHTLTRHGIRRALAFSSAMGQYLPDDLAPSLQRVMDFVDVDSDKWRQYAEQQSWPMNWVYRREARRLRSYDRAIAETWDASLLVSEAEAELFRGLVSACAGQRVHALHNGVDLNYFQPRQDYPSPYVDGEQALVFTGAMDYWANVDAVTWFADEVWPRVRDGFERARFYIVGARPSDAVQALAKRTGIVVTGTVKDVRPYLAHAHLAVAPLRVARGIQNKVLEAMAMARPLVMTPAAADGIPLPDLAGLVVKDQAGEFARACRAQLQQAAAPDQCKAIRDWVFARYDWERNLQRLDQWFPPLDGNTAPELSVALPAH